MGTTTRKTHRKTYSIVLMLIIMAGAGVWLADARQSEIEHVILISIDTCRADHLSCYGFDRPTTPQIDNIAREGMLFSRAQTPIPMTLPAHCSMLTGLYPLGHQVHDNYRYQLSDTHVTLAELLGQRGFITEGIVSAVVLTEKFGIGQGFANYQDTFASPERIGRESAALACDFISEHQRDSFFLFLHYYDPHHPYAPPEPYASEYADDLYAGEIAYTDQCIGQVIDQLKKLDLYDSTLILIVGDHGEGLGDHNELTHEYFIYQSTIHVPFIIKGPGISAGTICQDTVSLVDIAPTILGFLNLSAPDNMQGVDLSTYFVEDKEPEASRSVFIESLIPTKFGCNPLLGVVGQKWSYIKGDNCELYDLEQDPGERVNLVGLEDQRVRLMDAHLQDLMSKISSYETIENQLLLDSDTRKVLGSLGYVDSSSVVENFTLDDQRKDPKEMIACHEYIWQATQLFNDSQYEQSEALCLKVTSRWPEITSVYPMLMAIGVVTEEPGKIFKYGQDYVKLHPEDELKNSNLATSYLKEDLALNYGIISEAAARLQHYEEAVEYGEKSLSLSSNFSKASIVRNWLALAYFRLGQHQKAFALWEAALREAPDMYGVYENMGDSYYLLGDLDQATANYNRALRLNPGLVQVRKNLQIIANLKKIDQAIAQYVLMSRQKPNDPTIKNQLGCLHFQKGMHAQAADYWRQTIQLKPNWHEPHNNLAKLLATTTDPNLQDTRKALVHAEKAAQLNEFEDTAILETYCSILAINQKYLEAVNIAEKAVIQARRAGNKAQVENFNRIILQLKSKRDGK